MCTAEEKGFYRRIPPLPIQADIWWGWPLWKPSEARPRSSSGHDSGIPRKIVEKGKGRATVERCRKVSGESNDDEMAPGANYESDGELVGEAIGRSPYFTPDLAAVVAASNTVEESQYQQAFIKVGKIKYPEQVEVSSYVAIIFLIICIDRPRDCQVHVLQRRVLVQNVRGILFFEAITSTNYCMMCTRERVRQRNMINGVLAK